MFIKTFTLLNCVLASTLALAQTQTPPKSLGNTVDVQGLVTVSSGTQVAGVVNGSPVFNGTRYVTSSTGYVTLNFGRCEVKLKPNQSVVVDEDKVCEGMIAAIEPVPGPGGVFADGTPLLLLLGAAAAFGGTGGGAAAIGAGGGVPGGGSGGGVPTPPISNQ